jgi:hypothetical protein
VSALVVLNAVCMIWFSGAYPGRLIVLAPLIGCYTLAAERGWRWGLAGAVPTALIGIVAIRVVLGDTETAGVVPIAVLLAATAGSAGAAVGYYRAVLAATRAQLVRETQSREERARRLAVEERLRIARELHDVFGHAMATISVQAGVGLHVLEQRPGQAGEALAAIKKICDDGLTDVKLLRQPDHRSAHCPHRGPQRVSHPGASGPARMPVTARWSTSARWQWPAVRAGARRWPIFRCEAALLADWSPAIPQPSVARPCRLDAGHGALMAAELLVGVGGGGRDGCGCLRTREEADPSPSPVPVVVPISAPPVLD